MIARVAALRITILMFHCRSLHRRNYPGFKRDYALTLHNLRPRQEDGNITPSTPRGSGYAGTRILEQWVRVTGAGLGTPSQPWKLTGRFQS